LLFVLVLVLVLLVRRPAGGEIVDIGRQLVVHGIDVVERERPARRLHRNGTARPFGLLLLAALLTTAGRLGVGAEIAAARGCTRRGGVKWAGATEPAGRPRSTEA